jgi:deoxycytidylate deaminase
MLFNKYGFYSIHAEADAVMDARGGDTLVVVRIAKNGNLTCSFPCDRCINFMRDNGIKTVHYSWWDGSMKEMKL